MSDRFRWLICALAVALLPAEPARAQVTATLQGRFVRLADSTAALRHLINAREQRRRALGVADTLRHGQLVLVTTGTMPRTVGAALPLAWERLMARYGHRLDRTPLVVEIAASEGPQVSVLKFRTATATAGRSPAVRGDILRLSSLSRDSLAEVIAAVAGRPFWAGSDSVLTGWRETADPVWTVREVNLEALYELLVASPWTVPRRCFAGDLAACRSLLALDPAAHVLIASYTPEEREVMVHRVAALASSRVPPEQISACVSGRDPGRCDEVLVAAFPAPWSHGGSLGRPARQALLALALQMRGAGAFDTLVTSVSVPMGERLARTAGVSEDSLVSRWRNSILGARPQPVTVTPAGGWAAMGWATLLGLLALGSSRWR